MVSRHWAPPFFNVLGPSTQLMIRFDFLTRRNQNQRILVAYWLATWQNHSRETFSFFWFLVVRKSNTACAYLAHPTPCTQADFLHAGVGMSSYNILNWQLVVKGSDVSPPCSTYAFLTNVTAFLFNSLHLRVRLTVREVVTLSPLGWRGTKWAKSTIWVEHCHFHCSTRKPPGRRKSGPKAST